ncbi:HNH endonuclease signature motif containing protein [Brevundimonas faecalis]|uniref:HNH endonuclease signature motif containing protein n=1 Tax=Brevundimonas faecalis TaxID=947378 RepID=UPI003621866A
MAANSIEIAPSWRARVDRRGGGAACWPWTGGLMTNGYGQTRVRMQGRWRSAGAHQVAYYLATGVWERRADGRLVRHLCHNRLCCNPAHLRGGTALDNAWDRQARISGTALLPGWSLQLPVVGVAT